MSAAINRQRQNNHWRYFPLPIVKIFISICILCMLIAICFVVFKNLGNEHWLVERYLEFCMNLWNYSNLGPEMQLVVTNHAVVMLIVIAVISVIMYSMK